MPRTREAREQQESLCQAPVGPGPRLRSTPGTVGREPGPPDNLGHTEQRKSVPLPGEARFTGCRGACKGGSQGASPPIRLVLGTQHASWLQPQLPVSPEHVLRPLTQRWFRRKPMLLGTKVAGDMNAGCQPGLGYAQAPVLPAPKPNPTERCRRQTPPLLSQLWQELRDQNTQNPVILSAQLANRKHTPVLPGLPTWDHEEHSPKQPWPSWPWVPLRTGKEG